MIYQSYNFTDSFSNASGGGRQRMAISELAKLVREQPSVIRDVLESSNINVSRNITREGLGKIIRKNKGNREMARKLSLLIVASVKMNDGNNFFKKKDKSGATDGTEKKGLFKKIGGFFKDRKAKKLANKGTTTDKSGLGSKIGSFFKANQSEITSVGSSLLGGLFAKGGSSLSTQISGGSDGGGAYNEGSDGGGENDKGKQPMGMGTKVAIGLGVLVVLGVGVYFLRRPKN